MAMNNSCRFIGNMGADPETRYTQDGTCVVSFSLAVTEKFKDREGNKQERTEWPKFTVWGKPAEIINQYCTKGMKLAVDAKYSLRKWQDKDKNDRYSPEFTVQQFEFLGGGRDAGNKDAGQGSSRSSGDGFPTHGGSQEQKPKNNDPFATEPDFCDVPVDDDIPF